MPSAAVYACSQSSNGTADAYGKSSLMVTTVNGRPQKSNHGMTPWLWLTSIAVVLCSALPGGYHLGVTNAPQQILQSFCNETVYAKYGVALTASQLNLLWSSIVSVLLIGGMIGSLAAGILCNKFGRRGAILMVNWLGLFAAVLFAGCKAAASVEMLFVGRILAGLHAGFAVSAVPMYLTEIAPARVRSMLGVFTPIGMSSGIVVAMVAGLETILGTEAGWPYLLSMSVVPVMVGSMMLFCCPESPKYLYIIKGRTEQALKELSRLRGVSISELDDDVIEMKREAKNSLKSPAWSYTQLLTSRSVRLPLVIICVLHIGNQLSGISAVFYYSTGIFSGAGLSRIESQYASIGAGMANLAIALLAIGFVSRFGRRKLFLTSIVLTILCLTGMIISFVHMTAAPYVPYISIGLLISYVFVFGFGLGPIPFFIGSELFQPGPRPTGMSIGCTCSWFCNFLVGATFPTIQSILGDYSFGIFIVFLTVIGLFLSKYMPETKDRIFDDDTTGCELPATEVNYNGTEVDDSAIMQQPV